MLTILSLASVPLTCSALSLSVPLRLRQVGDFGLSKPTADAHDSVLSHNGGGGNLLYLAPESFLLQQFTEASDVFAFGIIVNEMMTGQRPYKDISPALAASECANRGARPNLASSTPVGIVRLICACWSHDPAMRPSFRQCLQTLEELRNEMAEESRAANEGSTDSTATTASAPASSWGGSATDSGSSGGSGGKPRKSKKSSTALPPPPVNAELEYYSSGIAAPAAATAATSTSPSKSSKRGGGKHVTMPSPSPSSSSSAGAADPMYNRPHTPEPDGSGATEEGEGSADTATPAATSSPPAASHHSLTPLISASPSVSPKDVRLFLLCLKKHLPPHDAFLLHKPQISAIDVLCETTNKNQKQSGSTVGSTVTGGGGGSGGSRGGGGGGGNPDSNSSSALRSRSEGDFTLNGDSTEGLPRSHACSPSFLSSMYPHRSPSVGELVVCRAKRADDMGALYDLAEYTAPQMVGLAPMQELTRRKMRSISKLVTLGQLDVLRVLHVDAERGCVDLSKKDVSDLMRSEVLTYYKQAEAAHHCVLRAASLLNLCSYCLYSSLVWPLAARFEGSVFKMLRMSLTNPTLTLGEYRECACRARWHAANAAALAGTASGVAQSVSAAGASTLLATPRVLPEIARRCEYNRVHLNLSRLTLDCLPKQLGGSEPDDPSTDDGAEGTDSSTNGNGTSKEKDRDRRPRNNRASSSATSSRRSSAAPAQAQTQPEKPSSGGGNSNGTATVRPLTYTLRSLNIEENPLRVLSPRIGLFRRLQELNVNCCGLTEDLPAALGEATGLQRLYAFGNNFTRIPSVVRKLLDLTQLNLSANRITRVEVGELSGLSQLLELSLARNNLETLLPGSLPVSLQTLDVSANHFARFPESLFGLPNLVSLEIKQNGITVVPGPPPSAVHYPASTNTATVGGAGAVPSVWPFVEWIDFSYNPIIDVHDSLFLGCSYLQWLNLAHTRIDKIPSSLFALIKPQPPQLSPNHTTGGLLVEEEKKSETDDVLALPSAPARASSVVTGLTYLNLTHTALTPSSTSASDWARLSSGVHHFLFDASAVPKTPAATVPLNGAAVECAPATAAATTTANPTSPPPPTSPMPALSVAVPASASAASSPPLIAHWSVSQVVSWLHLHSLGEFAPAFQDNLVNGDTLLELDKSDLRDLGVTKLGQQKQMLKLIAAQKEMMVAAAAKSQAATPSISVSASPALPSHAAALPRNNSGGDLNLSALSLGARAVDSQQQTAPPSVAVRRTNSTISPSGSLLTFAGATATTTSSTSALTTTAAGTAASVASDCDPRTCELVKSVLLNVCISHTELCRPVLLRCVVILLLGSVFAVDEARETLSRTVQAGREGAAAAGGAICTPFSGLYGGCQRAALSISPLLEPLYALSAPCLLPADGTALIEAATSAMSKALQDAGKGGRVKVCVRPYIVDLLPTDQAAGTTLTPAVVPAASAPASSAAVQVGAGAAPAAVVAGSASPSTTALTAAPLSSVPSLLLHRTGSAGKHAAAAAASAVSGIGAGATGLFGECGEMLAAWAAYRAAKAEEAREREAKRIEQAARKKEKAAAKEAAAAAEGQVAAGEKKKSKRKEGEKRATKEKSEAAISAGAFD